MVPQFIVSSFELGFDQIQQCANIKEFFIFFFLSLSSLFQFATEQKPVDILFLGCLDSSFNRRSKKIEIYFY